MGIAKDFTEVTIKEVKELFNRKKIKEQKKYDAVEAILKAANRTSIYITRKKNGKYKSNIHLSNIWMEAASFVRELDWELYDRLLHKSDYWANIENWTEDKIRTWKLSLLEIKRDANKFLYKE